MGSGNEQRGGNSYHKKRSDDGGFRLQPVRSDTRAFDDSRVEVAGIAITG